MLDEALDVLTGLWSGEPFSHRARTTTSTVRTSCLGPCNGLGRRCGWRRCGRYPRPLRRAARWDGVVPLNPTGSR